MNLKMKNYIYEIESYKIKIKDVEMKSMIGNNNKLDYL